MTKYLYKSIFFCAILLTVGANKCLAQYTVIGTKVQGGTANFGPMLADDTTDRYSRFAYIYPAATLGNLKHGDTIRSLEFFKDDFGSMKGKANFKLFIGTTSKADFGTGSLDWKIESLVSGVKKVYDGNPTNIVGNAPGYKLFEFDNNGYFVFDTTGGAIHLEILTEFTCDSAQSQVITWAYENNFSVSGFNSAQESKWKRGVGALVDYTNLNSINKPHLRINYYKNANNLEVRNIYCLGTIPLLMGIADTIKVIVKNVGLKTQYQRKVFLSIRGANFFNDSLVIDSIKPHQELFVNFVNHIPDTTGKETITITLGNDNDTSDNIGVFERNVNYNVYSHVAPYKSMSPGGIGFGGTTGDFVARFFTDSARYINQMNVEFGFGGRPFQFGIWDASGPGGTPGKNIFTSDTLTAAPGNVILPVLPRVKVEKTFFAGIRQVGTNNIGFAYQLEEPIRPGVFYFTAPLGDTNWTSFSPGYDFNFNVQPRLQVGDDISAWVINKPADRDTFDYNVRDTITPQATFINYGFNDQNTPFPVVYQIRDNRNALVYSDTQWIKLKSEDTLTVTFKRGFSQNNFGQFKSSVFSIHPDDRVLDNNQIDGNFWIVVRNDMAADNIFEPFNAAEYELNKDSIWPIARVINYGSNTQSNVPVTFRFRKDSTILYQRTKFVTLAGGNSQILSFDTFAVKVEGLIWAEVFTVLGRDSFSSNDTTRHYINVVKSKDVGVSAFLRPLEKAVVEKKVVFRPYLDVQNFGIKDQDTVPVIFEINYPKGALIYRDSVRVAVGAFSKTQALFKNFTPPDTIVTLQMTAYTKLKGDQLMKNDTLISTFDLYYGNDLAIDKILYPQDQQRFKAPSDTFNLKARVVNKGIKKITENVVFYCVVERNSTVVFNDTVTYSVSMNRHDTLEITTNKSFNSDITGEYKVTWYQDRTTDDNINNNVLNAQFFVTRDIDINLLSIEIPANNSTLEYKKDTVYPRLIVFNNGANTYSAAVSITLKIEKDGQTLYSEIVQTSGLIAGEAKIIDFTVPFSHITRGTAQVTAYIHTVDPFTENDSVFSTVFLKKSNDIACIAEQFPMKDSIYVKGGIFAPKVWVKNDGDNDQTTLFSVSCMVYINGGLKYTNNRSISLLADQTALYTFDSSLSFSTTGTGEALFFSLLGNDQERSNDTLRIPFYVTGGVGIEHPSAIDVNVFPNPAGTIVTVYSEQLKLTNWQLFDISGKLIFKNNDLSEMLKNKTVIDISQVQNGFYILEIETEKGVISKKIVVQH
jgi:hypothetical protein